MYTLLNSTDGIFGEVHRSGLDDITVNWSYRLITPLARSTLENGLIIILPCIIKFLTLNEKLLAIGPSPFLPKLTIHKLPCTLLITLLAAPLDPLKLSIDEQVCAVLIPTPPEQQRSTQQPINMLPLTTANGPSVLFL